MKKILLTACLPLAILVCSPQIHQVPVTKMAHVQASEKANASLQALREGNARFAANRMEHPNLTAARRAEVARAKQRPLAMILSCSDSRVPPEQVFDRGLGDLFVTRVAGNVVSDEVLGTLEYGADHLGIPLIVVLGHERCGAVEATVQGGEAPGHVKSLVKRIEPAVQEAKKHQPADLVDESVRQNVKLVVKQIETSQPVLAEMIRQGKAKVVGARYDLDTGRVDWL